jgi:hypothetical protein
MKSHQKHAEIILYTISDCGRATPATAKALSDIRSGAAMGFNLIGERVFVHQTRLQPQRININGPPKARECGACRICAFKYSNNGRDSQGSA